LCFCAEEIEKRTISSRRTNGEEGEVVGKEKEKKNKKDKHWKK